MTFAQYYDHDLAGRLIPALGDRSVVILDGRMRTSSLLQEAKSLNGFRRPKYKAVAICKGKNFYCYQMVTPITSL